MRFISIKTKMKRLLVSVLVVMAIFQAVIFTFSNNAFSKLSNDLQHQNLFNEYYGQLDHVQGSLLDYLNNPKAQKQAEIETSVGGLSTATLLLSEAFSHPQFTDIKFLTQEYIATAKKFMESNDSFLSEAAIKAYNSTVHLHGLISGRYLQLNRLKQEIIGEHVARLSTQWQVQTYAMIGMIVSLFIFLLWEGMRLIKRTVSPIITLTDKAQQIAAGNFQMQDTALQPYEHNDETLMLSNAFVYMAEKIKSQLHELQEKMQLAERVHVLEIENMEMQISFAQTEMCLMQSLINPHFLYNCLNMVSSLAYLENAPKVRECSLKIALYLRETLNCIGKRITVEQELDHTIQYIEIQKLRFGDRISFFVECDEESKRAVIPAIVIQPLVENALSHGIHTYLKGGSIKIRINRKGDTVYILVEDNGVGISPEKLAAIRDNIYMKFDSGGKGIGLNSVGYRVYYFFNGKASIEIESQQGCTGITVCIPYQEMQENEASSLQVHDTPGQAAGA